MPKKHSRWQNDREDAYAMLYRVRRLMFKPGGHYPTKKKAAATLDRVAAYVWRNRYN